jgi:hypothetical protein
MARNVPGFQVLRVARNNSAALAEPNLRVAPALRDGD